MKKLFTLTIAIFMLLFVCGCTVQTPDEFYSSNTADKPNAIGSVTISINCNTIKDKVENPVILDSAEFKINKGETVYDILLEATAKNKIHLETEGEKGSEYVVAVNNIYQMAYGEMSGWLFYINGEMAMTSMAQYELTPGDKIEILYSTNFGEDLK